MELGERWALVRDEHGYPEFLVIVGCAGDVWRQGEAMGGAPGFASFEIYEILATDVRDGESGDLIASIVFPREGGSSSADEAIDIADAERFAHGSVKWDGCANFAIDDNGVMLHAHDEAGMLSIGRALALAHHLCAQMVGS